MREGGRRLRQRLLAGAFPLLLLLAGCATEAPRLLADPPVGMPRHVELVETVFFPQERYQCGPATLAMSLRAAGLPATPDALSSQVFVPGREGSFQVEMLAAARRQGAVAVVLPPRLDALLAEVAAGNPVVVLQNLSLPIIPRWHYALAIGYDLDSGDLILRSGTNARELMPLSTFAHTWGRSDNWAMVTTLPGRLPRTAELPAVVEALVAFERNNPPAVAQHAYAAAVERWPDDLTLLMGLGNSAYAAGDRLAAAGAFRRATAAHPESGAAFNNLAGTLAELGDLDGALVAARRAVEIGGPWQGTARETLDSIAARRAAIEAVPRP